MPDTEYVVEIRSDGVAVGREKCDLYGVPVGVP